MTTRRISVLAHFRKMRIPRPSRRLIPVVEFLERLPADCLPTNRGSSYLQFSAPGVRTKAALTVFAWAIRVDSFQREPEDFTSTYVRRGLRRPYRLLGFTRTVFLSPFARTISNITKAVVPLETLPFSDA